LEEESGDVLAFFRRQAVIDLFPVHGQISL
jgi:hypothetical protein